MHAIKNKVIDLFSVAMVFSMTIGSCMAQKNDDMIRLEKKMDSILVLLQNNTTIKQPLKSDSLAILRANEKKYLLQISKNDSELNQLNLQLEKLKKEKEQIQKNESETKAQMQKSISALLSGIMQNGSFTKQDVLDNLKKLGSEHQATNSKEFTDYAAVCGEVIGLNEEFVKFSNYDSLITKAWELHSKSYNYAELHTNVKNIIFKLKNYCDYELKLIEVIDLSQTQSSEENRKKQLLRREDDFNDYPYLRGEIEKIKANKNHLFIKKCKS
jgi:hypothetical protein